MRACIWIGCIAACLTSQANAQAIGKDLLPPPPAGNKVSIRQIGQDNWVTVSQTSGFDEAQLTEQIITDANGNRAIVIQQGTTNITDLTQQGQLENVIATGSVLGRERQENADGAEKSAQEAPYPADTAEQ